MQGYRDHRWSYKETWDEPGRSLEYKYPVLIKDCLSNSRKYAPEAFVVVVTNRFWMLWYGSFRASGLPPHRCSRNGRNSRQCTIRSFLAKGLMSLQDVSAMIFRSHGDDGPSLRHLFRRGY